MGEEFNQLGIAVLVAAAVISLFAILRLVTRSKSSATWLGSYITAYTSAVALTIAVAGSLGYLGYALQPFMPTVLAGVGAIALHIGLLAAFRMLLPVRDSASDAVGESSQRSDLVGA